MACLLVISACSAEVRSGAPSARNDDAGRDDASDGGATSITDGDDDDDEAAPTLVSIAITPAELELSSANGARVEAEFSVTGTYDDGTTQALENVTYSLANANLGSLGEYSGKFIAFGTAGGVSEVRARFTRSDDVELEASAELRVLLKRELFAPGITPEAIAHFDGAPVEDPARAASLVYPLEGAVMPQNVFPADVQWLNGAPGDLFEIKLEKPHAKVRAIVSHDGAAFGNHYLVDASAWRALASSDPDTSLRISVERFEAATATLIASPMVNMRFARAALLGSIYYWDIEAGQIRRIDDGTNQAITFMPTPPEAIGGSSCVGCHSISPSGRYMSGRLGGGENVGGVFDLTRDLTVAPVPTAFPVVPRADGSARWWFSSWSPDETRMVVSLDEGGARRLGFLDPFTGLDIAMAGTMPSAATHPAWSPDGTTIAFTANLAGWGGNHSQGDIAVLPVTSDAVGEVSVLHQGASLATAVPAGNADSYPSWSPDSQFIAFAHGNNSRSESGQAALYGMARDGTNLVRLDRASGGPNAVDTFQPRFSPFDAGGYFWVSYLSRRDYGNAEAGTRGTARQQIWVSGIKKNRAPGEDPSEVGYWIPGQSIASRNISAFWAPRACRDDGESCTVGGECCGGTCGQNAQGELVCSPPPPEECREAGQTCASDGDCCGEQSLFCYDHVCSYPVQ